MNRVAWASCALYIFCICGFVGFSVDLDHIWSIFGIPEPFTLTGWDSRPFHTALVFIMVAFIAGGIITALTNRSVKFRQCLELLDERIVRRVSPICGSIRDEFDYNISNNSMVVIETFGIPEQGMSTPMLGNILGYARSLRGILKVYRQTTLEEFGIGE